jgi:hypothetical protein
VNNTNAYRVTMPVGVTHPMVGCRIDVIVLVAMPPQESSGSPSAQADKRESHNPRRHVESSSTGNKPNSRHSTRMPDCVATTSDEPANTAPLGRCQLRDSCQVVSVQPVPSAQQ